MLSLRRVSTDEFDSFALTHAKGNFHQTQAMISFRELMGWDVHPLFLYEDDTIIGALVFAGKAGRYEVTMGPLFDFTSTHGTQALLDELTVYARGIKATWLEIYPYEVYQTRSSDGQVLEAPQHDIIDTIRTAGWKHKGLTSEYDAVANRWAFVKDLSEITSADALLASYRQTTRQTVRKVLTDDYSVKKLSYDELHIAKTLVDSSYTKNDVSIRPLEYYQRLFTAFGDAIEFLVVYYQGVTPISTGVFISHPNEMVYFMSGADTEYRHLYGGHHLQHYVMSRCVEQGMSRYNFYGVSGNFTKNPLLVYKAGFRGYVEEYVGGFVKTIRPAHAFAKHGRQAAGRFLRKVMR